MSVSALSAKQHQDLKETHQMIAIAERDIKRCLRQILAPASIDASQSEQARIKGVFNKIVGLIPEAPEDASSNDLEIIMNAFDEAASLKRDLNCLQTRIAIVANKLERTSLIPVPAAVSAPSPAYVPVLAVPPILAAPEQTSSTPFVYKLAPSLDPTVVRNLETTRRHRILDKATICTKLDRPLIERTSTGSIVTMNGTVYSGLPKGVSCVSTSSGDFRECLYNMLRLGVKIMPVTQIDVEKEPSYRKIGLEPSKNTYPVCEAGENRSQLTYAELRGMGMPHVQPPHGAFYGVDPIVLPPRDIQAKALSVASHPRDASKIQKDVEEYLVYVPLSSEKLYGDVRPILRYGEENNSFEKLRVFKQAKKDRLSIDSDVFLRLSVQRERMNQIYFDRIIKEGGQIITFNRALHGVMFRLRERAKALGVKDLSHVTIIPIESNNPMTAGTAAADPKARAKCIRNFRLSIRQLFPYRA